MLNKFENLKSESRRVSSEIRQKLFTYILAAFGVVAGLAWNEAIRSLIDRFFPLDSSGGLMAKFIYAIIITIVVVFLSMYILRIEKNK